MWTLLYKAERDHFLNILIIQRLSDFRSKLRVNLERQTVFTVDIFRGV